jgi:uncharacterized membrane protein
LFWQRLIDSIAATILLENAETQNKNSLLKRITVTLALSGVMAALVAIATFLIQIPVPATGGYLNFGDIMIFVTSLTFGPIIGGLAGGIGSFISDVAGGYAATFAPFTLVIKGAEGLIAGLISNRKAKWGDILGVAVGGAIMVLGYFLAEFYPLQIGWAASLEIPGNILQIVVGGVVGIPIALVLRRRLPEAWKR